MSKQRKPKVRRRSESKEQKPTPRDEAPKRPVGRPPLELPELIPDTPENIAKTIVGSKPKKRGEWRFEKNRRRKKG